MSDEAGTPPRTDAVGIADESGSRGGAGDPAVPAGRRRPETEGRRLPGGRAAVFLSLPPGDGPRAWWWSLPALRCPAKSHRRAIYPARGRHPEIAGVFMMLGKYCVPNVSANIRVRYEAVSGRVGEIPGPYP